MTKIFLTNCTTTRRMAAEENKGSAGHIIATIEMLRACINDVEFSTFIQFSEAFVEKYRIKVLKNKLFRVKIFSLGTILKSWSDLARCALWRLFHKSIPSLAGFMVGSRELKEYASADVIVDLSMDTFSDDFGTIAVIEHCKDVLLGILLEKPVIIWAQSPGPFKSRLTSWLVRYTLNRVALITVRENISLGYVRELNVDVPPVHFTADPAFLLEAAPENVAKEILASEDIDPSGRPLIGVTMTWSSILAEAKRSKVTQFIQSSYLLMRIILPERCFQFVEKQARRIKRFNMMSYVKVDVINEMIDYLVDELGATVVLIPHDTEAKMDDRVLAQEIFQRSAKGERVKLITGDYTAPEIKAVIGQCDVFIGGKMHANIAAISMHVPTIAIRYGHKFHGIMSMLGQEGLICDGFIIEDIKSKIDKAWSERKQIKAELEKKVAILKEQAIDNARLLADLLKRLPEQQQSCHREQARQKRPEKAF